MLNRSRSRSRVISFCCYLLLVAFTAAACSSGTPQVNQPTTGTENRILRVGVQSNIPLTVSPFESQQRQQGVIENIYEPLVYPYRDTFEIKGVLAESWTESPDGTTWRFKLRKDVKFHDGTPFTAESVKLSLEYMRKVGRASGKALLDVIQEVRIIDDLTVEFVIKPANLPFLAALTGLTVASAKALKEHPDDPNWFAANAVGTGPYSVKEFRPKDRLVLARNENWWGKKPYFAEVFFLEIPEPATKALMLERGELDIAYNVPPETLDKLDKLDHLNVVSVKGDRVVTVRMNQLHGPLTNPDLRKALAYAFPYAGLIQARDKGLAPSDGPVPSQYMDGWVPPDLIKTQDLAKAKEYLAKAGYKPGELTLQLVTQVGSPDQTTMGELFQAALRSIGVNLNIVNQEAGVFFPKLLRFIAERKPEDAIDMFIFVRGPYVPHAYAYFSSYEKNFYWNVIGYANEQADALFAKGYKAKSPAEAFGQYKQGIPLILADNPDIWIATEKRVVVLNSNLSGYYMHPTWFPETHVWELSRKGP